MGSLGTFLVYGRSRWLFMAVLSMASLLAGCGGDQKKPATQVAAKVGADEITISQVNGVFAKLQAIPGKDAAQVRRDVLDSLIDQQLAMRQAIESKLDREPAVMQAIEEAKRSILARAYTDKIRAAITSPSAAEVSKYYVDHPELFAQRRVFNLNELNVAAQSGLVDTLRTQIGKGVTLETIAAELKSKSIPFSGNASTHVPEETPFEILSKISVLKDGQMTLIEGKSALTILQLVTSRSAPVDEKTASASIQQYLSNTHSGEEIVKELKSLKKNMKIEYFGEFAASGMTDITTATADASGKIASESSARADMAKAVATLK